MMDSFTVPSCSFTVVFFSLNFAEQGWFNRYVPDKNWLVAVGLDCHATHGNKLLTYVRHSVCVFLVPCGSVVFGVLPSIQDEMSLGRRLCPLSPTTSRHPLPHRRCLAQVAPAVSFSSFCSYYQVLYTCQRRNRNWLVGKKPTPYRKEVVGVTPPPINSKTCLKMRWSNFYRSFFR